jgi:hypothetical protein
MKTDNRNWLAIALAVLLIPLLVLLLYESQKSSKETAEREFSTNSFSSLLAGQKKSSQTNQQPISVRNTSSIATNSIVATLPSGTNTTNTNYDGQISASVLKQIAALEKEKGGRTPTQQKIDTQLLYADKMQRGVPIADGVPVQRVDLDKDDQGRILVDIKADVTDSLLQYIKTLGGNVVNDFPQYQAIRAGVPLANIEQLAGRGEVKFVEPAVRAMNNTVDSQGDYTHQANTARTTFGVNGTGVKVGVLSDSVDYLASSQINGLVTVLPGQDGMPATGEGTAMLEIVNDLAPGAQLYFATRGTSEAQFASNIRNLRSTYGCDIIVDDILYDDESPFQDGIVAQAVNTVTASGAIYFSSASNSGNKDDGTSGTWEGDFSDGGQTTSPLEAGRIHSFGIANYDTCLGSGPGGSELRADLFWSDPLGASTNDYDLYVLDSTGSSVIASSTNPQNGTQDPYENVGTLSSGERIVIVKWSGAGRFLHLSTGRGLLSVSTQGSTRGHDCATNAFNVAATDAKNSYPNPFTGGAANPVETFSSDGTRRVFFQADGTPITAGNFSSSGGAVRQKPDITAADDITTDIPGFAPFAGTSAAAPHAAAIAALLKSYNQSLTASQIRTILTNTALDTMSAGVDRDSGAGIVMALPALQQSPVPTPVVVPASMAGNAMGGIITSGDYPFTASGGYFLFIPANSGNTYQLVEVDDEAGLYSILTGSGTYSYTASGSTGLFQFVQGSDTFKGNLNFVTTNIGNYLLTNITVAPIVASETGEYEFYQVAVPASIAGKSFRVFIQDGISPFYQTGTFDFKTSVSGTSYTIVDDDTGITNSTGTYSYSKINSATAQVIQNDTALGTATDYVVFSSASEGEFLATQSSSGGFQIGHFVLVDTTKPSVSIQFPTAGTRLTNSTFTAQGTATDDVQVAGVAYQLNTNGWAVAIGTTNWSAANLAPMPGTNTFSAYAVDTSGNISTTNQVSFVYILSALLTVQTNGSGSINPNYNGALLAIGSNYTMTATAGAGFAFTNWTDINGTVLTNGSTIKFVMQSNLVLNANFVDVTKPTLSITNPMAGQRWSNVVFMARGTATDNWQVASVQYQLNGGIWNNASGTTNWSASLTLTPGTNTIAAYATDTTGNNSATNSVSFDFVVTNQLQIRTTGLGTVSPNYSNAWLEIGRNYSITSAPASGFVFTNWLVSTNWIGSATVTGTNLQFTMQSNLTLQANFLDVTKPTIAFTAPTSGQRWSNSVFTVQGTAGDNWQVSNVWYLLNGLAWSNATTANAWTNWSATVNLVAGTNSLQAYAVDSSGNVSTTNSVSFDFVVTNQLQIRTTGLGTVSPNYSNAWLEIGRNYSITSAPASGFVFTNWLVSTNWIGGALVTGTNLLFMMQSNLTLQANFLDVTKPILTITAPTSGQHMTNALATVVGTASDNWKVTGVWYQLNGGTWNQPGTTNSWTNWMTTVELQNATNNIEAYAVDLGGNFSTTNSVSFVSSNAFKLLLAFTTLQPLATNGLNFVLQISPGLNGHIQISTNLATWTALTNFVGTNTTLNFRDPTATNSSQRFYRAIIP